MEQPAPEYVTARMVLLDALAALEHHLNSVVLVGAQAVYFHAGEAHLNIPLMTTDADLALNTLNLGSEPEIGSVMRAAGFIRQSNPGHWIGRHEVSVDLMVVPHQSGVSRMNARAARLDAHEEFTARIAKGLEPALIDNATALVCALDPSDGREFHVRVAGPSALLTAKAIKIRERLEQASAQPDRLKEKDALDIYRILQAIETADLVQGFLRHDDDEHAALATAEAIEIYRTLATAPQAPIPQLAAAAAQGDPAVAPSFAALVTNMLDALASAREKR